jgi:hypothetical protein
VPRVPFALLSCGFFPSCSYVIDRCRVVQPEDKAKNNISVHVANHTNVSFGGNNICFSFSGDTDTGAACYSVIMSFIRVWW